MKQFRLLILLGMFICGQHGWSQVFGYPGATWVFHNTQIWAVCFDTYQVWEYQQDTVIMGKLSKDILVTQKSLFPPSYYNTTFDHRYFWVSGDSVSILKEVDSTWQLLFDFSVQIGDTTHSPLTNSFAFGFSCDSALYQFPAIVTNAGITMILGNTVKFYTVKYRVGLNMNDNFSDTTYAYQTYYERLINAHYWYPPDNYFCGMVNECTPFELVCYKDSTMLTDSSCANLTWFDHLSMPGESEINFNIYPNPTTNLLIVETAFSEPGYYDILSVDGKLITSNIQSPINVSHLPAGIYFLTDHDRTGFQKFIKN